MALETSPGNPSNTSSSEVAVASCRNAPKHSWPTVESTVSREATSVWDWDIRQVNTAVTLTEERTAKGTREGKQCGAVTVAVVDEYTFMNCGTTV